MRHFPIFIDLAGKSIAVSGAGASAIAKIRLFLKTEAKIFVYGTKADNQLRQWQNDGFLILIERPIERADLANVALVYAANDDEAEDLRVKTLAKQAGILANVVDNLEESDFITPAIVDRDPVTIAIGTEGAAPVLARQIKADLEASLPVSLGILARIGQKFRKNADVLPRGRIRRDFWNAFYFGCGPKALASGGEAATRQSLEGLLQKFQTGQHQTGKVNFIGTGQGIPDLMTLREHRILHEADVVIHDHRVSKSILELARREAKIIETGRKAFGHIWKQDDINDAIGRQASRGLQVARLFDGNLLQAESLLLEAAYLEGQSLDHEMVGLAPAESALGIPDAIQIISNNQQPGA